MAELTEAEKTDIFERLRQLDRFAGGAVVLGAIMTVLLAIISWQLSNINKNMVDVAVLKADMIQVQSRVSRLEDQVPR